MPSSQRKRKQLTMEPCVVCSQLTSEFNYKVTSCNKCKMVFRRAVKSESSISPCTCHINGKSCRLCKFYACIRAGMQISSNSFEVPAVIQQLMNLNSKRLSTYFKYQMTDDVGLEEVVDCGYVKKRDKDVIFTSHDWVLMEIYTNIQFIKGFHLVNLLSSNDLMYFLKNSYFKCAIYFIAVRSYLENVESMTFPFNVDVFPEEISQVSSYNPILLNRVRCRLISKFIDFRLTQEELLLSVAIIFCDPYASGLSKDAQNVISQYQNIYTSTLMRLCFQTKQNSGPERFANILSLSQTLTKTIEELSYVVELFKLHQPGLPMRKLVKDSF